MPTINVSLTKRVGVVILLAMAVIAIVISAIVFYAMHLHNSNSTNAPSPAAASPHVSVHGAFAEFVDQTTIFDDDEDDNIKSGVKSRAIFLMGDSSVDCGDNALFYPLLRHNLSMFPCSNGSVSTLIPHFLAKKMGLPDIPTFYEQNGTIEGILSGLNYGSAQAAILPSPNIPNFQSLNQQLRQVFETIQLLQLQLGEQKAQNFINSSVFYLSLGKDDYINFLFENSSFASGYNGDTQLVPRLLVDELTNAFKDLYDAGARKIVSMGIYPLGCAPRVVVDWYFLTGRNTRKMRVCVGEVNQLILQHNKLLSDHIIDLNMEFSDAQFVFCDVYQGFSEIMSNPQKYGFKDVRGACCGRGWHGAASGCQSLEMACNQSSASHVWWDFYNPTQAVNSLLADSAWSGKPLGDICHPLNIQRLVNL